MWLARRAFLAFFAGSPVVHRARAADGMSTGLHIAAQANDVALIKKLLETGAGIDARDADRRTALLIATHANDSSTNDNI